MSKKGRLPIKRSAPYYSPVDPRILPDIFSFGHVKGVARVFLMIEIVLSTLMVLATSIIVILHALSY